MDSIIQLLIEHNLHAISSGELGDLKSTGEEKLRGKDAHIYTSSLYLKEGTLYFIAMDSGEKNLYLFSRHEFPGGFSGETRAFDGFTLKKAALDTENAAALKREFPFTAPVSLREKWTTVGCGDRLGIASAAHIKAIRDYDAYPVLAQQSIRELNFTGRNFESIVADAAFMVFQEGYEKGWGADGDHLKTLEDVDTALKAGMPMITLDLTENLHPEAAEWEESKIDEEFKKLPGDVQKYIDSNYGESVFEEGEIQVRLSGIEARKCALMYLDALEFAAKVDTHIESLRGEAYDLEISIDETSSPTLPSHHLFIIKELLKRDVKVNSLAPRFIGEFQKGIDYIGDLGEFERQFAVHCAIAQAHGNYKVSIHSGSDKFSVYPVIGSYTKRRVHLKTAGTSWVEALRTIARAEPDLYRLMHKKALEYFPEALKSYHITADIEKIPDIDSLQDSELEKYLDTVESRQMLHVSYGGLLNDKEVREPFFRALADHEELHDTIIKDHIEKHLVKLGVEKIH
ncbi:MAG: tagaturonate epimerase family protein [Spirochaetaceae bacterium]